MGRDPSTTPELPGGSAALTELIRDHGTRERIGLEKTSETTEPSLGADARVG